MFLEGTLERITFQSEDSGYTIARLQTGSGPRDLVTVVGPMAAAQPGERLRLEGDWATHPKYGRQFKYNRYQSLVPATVEGICKYLGSGLIKGIGPVTARRIVAHFGLETLEVIEEQPDRLLEVEGTGPKRVEVIKSGWAEQRQIKDVMLFLQSNGVSTNYAVKIYKQYGDEAVSLVRANPYRLERDIWGIGFLSADRIAQNMGISRDAPQRIQAGLRYVLNQASDEGHVFLPRTVLLESAQKELEVDGDLIPAQLDGLVEEGGAILDEERVYLPPLYFSEMGIAASVRRLLASAPGLVSGKVDQVIDAMAAKQGLAYDEHQREAIHTAAAHRMMVLTGGPGTGKTTITRAIIGLFDRQGLRVLLCSPTGRAAKKLSEATQRGAKTVHRLLGFKPPREFEHDENNPLKADAVVVDEVSMMDTVLMHHLLRAVPTGAQLVLVGDIDQLPSVGPGNVLRDLIDCGTVPVVRLTHIFRQAQESQIVTNAHRINQGGYPHIDNRQARDFFFAEVEEPEQIVATISQLCGVRLPRRYGLDKVDDIQVLTPMYRSITGAGNLNRVLQQELNPGKTGVQRGAHTYCEGDKVMQVRNNYEKAVFNGDVGRIETIDPNEQTVGVRFDVVVDYDYAELDELVLAYAVSVHKAQGSEYRAVVVPVTTQHYMMLQRNLLYTAITRARELVVLIGSKKALALAVRNDRIAARYTGLAERLQA